MEWTAGAHVVLGMDFEKVDVTDAGQDVVRMLGFKPDTNRFGWQRMTIPSRPMMKVAGIGNIQVSLP